MKLKLKINLPVGDYKKGDIVEVDADEQGTPLVLFWRKRLNDAQIDSCVEIIPDKPKKGAE